MSLAGCSVNSPRDVVRNTETSGQKVDLGHSGVEWKTGEIGVGRQRSARTLEVGSTTMRLISEPKKPVADALATSSNPSVTIILQLLTQTQPTKTLKQSKTRVGWKWLNSDIDARFSKVAKRMFFPRRSGGSMRRTASAMRLFANLGHAIEGRCP